MAELNLNIYSDNVSFTNAFSSDESWPGNNSQTEFVLENHSGGDVTDVYVVTNPGVNQIFVKQILGVDYNIDGDTIEFELASTPPDAGGKYNVRAEINPVQSILNGTTGDSEIVPLYLSPSDPEYTTNSYTNITLTAVDAYDPADTILLLSKTGTGGWVAAITMDDMSAAPTGPRPVQQFWAKFEVSGGVYSAQRKVDQLINIYAVELAG